MLRISKKPILIPGGVITEVVDSGVKVLGPKGEIKVKTPRGILVEIKEKNIFLKPEGVNLVNYGKARANLANAVRGVSEGWSKNLEIVGTGFRAATDGQILTLYLGFSHPVVVSAPEGITFSVQANKIGILGVDSQLVGQVAANIRKIKKPEPYKGKGIRYEGEFIRRKQGKAAKGVGA